MPERDYTRRSKTARLSQLSFVKQFVVFVVILNGKSTAKSRSESTSGLMQDSRYQVILVTVNARSEAIDLLGAD